MATRRWKIHNLTSGTVALSFRKDPLGVGETLMVVGELADDVKFLKGAKKVMVTEVLPTQTEAPRKATPEPAVEPTSVSQPSEKPRKPRSEQRNPEQP